MTSWLLRVLPITVLLALGACRAAETEPEPGEAAPSQEDSAESETVSGSAAESVTPAVSEREDPRPPSREEPESRRPEPPAAPELVEVEIPGGTILELELLTALDSSANRVGDEIQARTLAPLYAAGQLALGEGAYVQGRVTEVEASGRVKGRAKLAFTFDRIRTTTGLEQIRTSFVEQEAKSGKKKDATIIGGATGVGAIVGGIIGGKKGAAIGAAIGGAGGTSVVLTTKGEEIRLPVGAQVNVRLDDPLKVALD
ncbi:MAG TPA: hypothetical protein VEK15_29235 [Vicinamibacteria bacterium]|nr:hypothetical protein [Vicinamibacteria bacterium]